MSGFDQDGFALIPELLSAQRCAQLAAQVALAAPGMGGTRCLLPEAWCAALAAELLRHPALAGIIPPASVAVQCTYFEKSAERNWLVPIHQDLSIPVAARVEAAPLRGWSEKEGALFVQAPPAVLERLVAVRLHLDDCGPDDGPLRVVPRTHRRGVISNEDAIAARAEGETTCVLATGGALALRPLLLHASSKGRGSSRRRVLHMVFGPKDLPYGLRWPDVRLNAVR